MNCFLLFLLLGCCGWGDGCGCNPGRGGCGCRTEQPGCCLRAGREMPGRRCCEGMGSGRNDSCRRETGRPPGGCDCDEERRGCDCCEERRGHDCCEERRGCECGEERHGCGEGHHGHGGCGCMERENTCDSGMIPPPWQEYPRFPRRDTGEECDG